MSRAHDPLLGTTLKKAAIGPSLHWTDIALLTIISKANEALREAELNIPRCLKNAGESLRAFADGPSHDQEKEALEQYRRDLKQVARHANRCVRRADTLIARLISQRYPE